MYRSNTEYHWNLSVPTAKATRIEDDDDGG